MKRRIKRRKIYLKPLKRVQRKKFTQKNCKSLKVMQKKLPVKIAVNKTHVFYAKKTPDEFNKLFTNIGTDLENKIPNASKRFDSYIAKVNISMEFKPLSINELKDARIFSIKVSKSPGHDGGEF